MSVSWLGFLGLHRMFWTQQCLNFVRIQAFHQHRVCRSHLAGGAAAILRMAVLDWAGGQKPLFNELPEGLWLL